MGLFDESSFDSFIGGQVSVSRKPQVFNIEQTPENQAILSEVQNVEDQLLREITSPEPEEFHDRVYTCAVVAQGLDLTPAKLGFDDSKQAGYAAKVLYEAAALTPCTLKYLLYYSMGGHFSGNYWDLNSDPQTRQRCAVTVLGKLIRTDYIQLTRGTLSTVVADLPIVSLGDHIQDLVINRETYVHS